MLDRTQQDITEKPFRAPVEHATGWTSQPGTINSGTAKYTYLREDSEITKNIK